VSARVAVVGGGISGLVAARALAGAGLQVTVLEAGGRWGGKINSTVLDGIRLDVGAESLLARRPEGLALIESLGLHDQLVQPSDAKPELLVGGRLHRMPRSVTGVPTDLEQLDGVLSVEGLARARSEPTEPTVPAGDVAIGRHVDERLGPEVTDRLVEPFLGGVYAGHARELSFSAVSPELFRRVGNGGSLVDQARAVADTVTSGPIFAGLTGGLNTLIDALMSDLDRRGVSLQLTTTVRALNRIGQGYELATKSTTSMDSPRADAVVIAVPWPAAAKFLADQPIAGELAAVPYASMAVVTMIVSGLRTGASGLLAPPGELPTIKAVTCSSIKWPWLAEIASQTWGSEATVVRASVGRLGEEHLLQVGNDILLARTFAEARGIPGWERIGLVTGHVQRWGGALPQYLVGHPDRVARLRRQVDETPRLALCGAALDGIGIAACIGSGADAAAKIISDLGGSERNHQRLQEESAVISPRDINETVRYTMWSVFRRTNAAPLSAGDADAVLDAVNSATSESDLVIRGWYDVAGLRADADLMVWWHATKSESLQDAYAALRRSELGRQFLSPVWSVMGLHRPAEFNKGHVPAFMADEVAKLHLCVYPFVRSYEWYLLPEEERRAMLVEHGMLARPYPDVRANTVSAFALGDYEWILAFEADELHRIVDLMRALRAAAARRHTREEIPFYTGRRRELSDILASW